MTPADHNAPSELVFEHRRNLRLGRQRCPAGCGGSLAQHADGCPEAEPVEWPDADIDPDQFADYAGTFDIDPDHDRDRIECIAVQYLDDYVLTRPSDHIDALEWTEWASWEARELATNYIERHRQ
jgi:hypothetical protein